jgi:hypothetical protein
MRNRLTIATAALVLASASLAWTQTKQNGQEPQQEQQVISGEVTGGIIDISGRLTSTSGDEARYERYRDLRNGADVNFAYSKVTADWTFNVTATSVGYRDQRYSVGFNSKRVKFAAAFNQIPLNYMYGALTPYSCTAGNCTLDPALRAEIQAARGTKINATTGAYSPVNTTPIGVPQSLSQLTAAGTIYNSIAKPFDMQSLRSTFSAHLIFAATDNLNLLLGYDLTKKTGQQPWGASFAFPNAVEVPVVIDNTTTDVTAAVEWASHQGMMRMGYTHSKFDQAIASFTFDNPLYATDYNVYNPVFGWYYDSSGYSSAAGGAATGRTAMPPTNTVNAFDWLGMIKLPGHTTANGSLTMSANRQDATLIPWTTNTTIANSLVYQTFPGLASLPRDTANMRVNYTTGTFNVSSHPIRYVNLSARYRYSNRSDFTREFDAIEYVRFDAVPEETGGATEPFQINRNTLTLNASFTRVPHGAIRVGYTYDLYEHSVRATTGWKDGIFRVSYDAIGNEYVTVRAVYEHAKREAIDTDEEDIFGAGGQPALRFFDEASRNRNKGSLILELNPLASVGVNFSLSTGKDDYQGADKTQEFGLLNTKNSGWAAGVTYAPNAKMTVGADYGRETYNSLQQSRNANPAPDAQWTDPNRDWTMTQDETVNYFSAYANIVELVTKTDISFGYDFSNSDQAYVHGGPRVDPNVAGSLAAVGQFIPLPDVTNSWHRASIDVKYNVNKQMGVGFSYWYEKFNVADYATINSAGPATLPVASLGAQTDVLRIDWLGGLFTGYGNRPYKGQTAFVRVYYLF